MFYYLVSIWPLVTLAVIALVLADDLLRSRHRGGSQVTRRTTWAQSLVTSRLTRHRFLWVSMLGSQTVMAALASVLALSDRFGADGMAVFLVLLMPFSELAALVFLLSPFLAALYWLRMKFNQDARADVLAIALWYSPVAVMSGTMLVGLALEPEASVAAILVLATSLTIGSVALLAGMRSIRHDPVEPMTGTKAWLMFGFMLQHAVLAWMHFGMLLPHAFVSVLAFGWAHSVWLRESGRDVGLGGFPRRHRALVAGFGTTIRPFLAALTWAGVLALWMSFNGAGWSADYGMVWLAAWTAGIASTMFLVWATLRGGYQK